jgi:hypothetical protein
MEKKKRKRDTIEMQFVCFFGNIFFFLCFFCTQKGAFLGAKKHKKKKTPKSLSV